MLELQKYISQEFGLIRGIEINDNAYLVGKDVANKLGYQSSKDTIIRRVDEEDRILFDKETQRLYSAEFDYKQLGQRGGWLINESGFYALVFGSELPTAKKFKHWVTSEVLPSICKHGVYATDETLDNIINNPEFGIKLLTELKQEREEKKLLQEQINHQKPLVEFAKTVKGSDTNILVRETSKLASNYIGVDIGESGLYKVLRKWGFVCKKQNEPTQKAYNQGILEYIECKTRIYPYTARTVKVTPKGQIYIVTRLIKEFIDRTVA